MNLLFGEPLSFPETIKKGRRTWQFISRNGVWLKIIDFGEACYNIGEGGQFQSADRNPWQNISWKVNSCWTWLCTTSHSPVRSDWPIVQFSFPAKSLFPAISSSCSIIPCHVSLFPATFPATSSILPATSVYLPPPQCPLVSIDTWKQMTDRISDWTIGFHQETSVQSELRLDCPTRDWSDRPIEKLGSMRFYAVIGSYKVTDWPHQ